MYYISVVIKSLSVNGNSTDEIETGQLIGTDRKTAMHHARKEFFNWARRIGAKQVIGQIGGSEIYPVTMVGASENACLKVRLISVGGTQGKHTRVA